MFIWFLLVVGSLLLFGFLVDLWYKKQGITDLNPEENAKHVSGYERAVTEAYMSNMKDDYNNGSF
jgi:hypothetical protein